MWWFITTAWAQNAGHHGEVTGETILWRTRVLGSVEQVGFAQPLPPGTQIAVGDGELLRNGAGGVVGLRTQGIFSLEIPQNEGSITVPWLAGDGLQRVTVDDRVLVLEGDFTKHIRRWTTPNVTRKEARWLDRQLGEPRSSMPLTAEVSDLPAGLGGSLEPIETVGAGALWGLAGGSVFLGLLGWVLHRALGSVAKKEQNEAYIERMLG